MTMLPPTQPVVPSTAGARPNTAKSSGDGGKEFASTLDKATSEASAQDDASKPATDKADAKTTDGSEAKPTEDDAKADTPVDGDAPVEAVENVQVQAGTDVAVVTANLQATDTVEVAAVAADPKAVQAKTDAVVTAGPAIVATEDSAKPAVATPGVTSEVKSAPTTGQPQATQQTQAPTTVQVGQLPVDGAQATTDLPVETPIKELATALTDEAPAPKAGTESTVRTTTESVVNNLTRTAEAPKLAHAPQTLPEPVRQVVQLVHPLRHQGDGDYKLTLQLYPEHLGRVEVAVTLNSGQISMQLTADNQQSRQMLREAMGDLRQALSDSGLDTGSLDVSDHQFNGQSQKETTQSGQIRGTAVDMDEDTFLAGVAERVNNNQAATDGAVDVRV